MRALISWLSKRFPEQLVVTKSDLTQMREELGQYNILHQNQATIVEKIASIEKRLQALENVNGFVKTAKGGFNLER